MTDDKVDADRSEVRTQFAVCRRERSLTNDCFTWESNCSQEYAFYFTNC